MSLTHWANKSYAADPDKVRSVEGELVFFDPVSIAIYVNIIIGLIKIYKAIKSAQGASQDFNENTVAHQERVLKATRREMGWWAWWRRGRRIASNVANGMREIDSTEIEKLYREVDSNR